MICSRCKYFKTHDRMKYMRILKYNEKEHPFFGCVTFTPTQTMYDTTREKASGKDFEV